MPRQSYKDSYGDVTKYEIPEEKRCPICRREVDEQEVKYVSEQKSAHPEIDDGGYTLWSIPEGLPYLPSWPEFLFFFAMKLQEV